MRSLIMSILSGEMLRRKSMYSSVWNFFISASCSQHVVSAPESAFYVAVEVPTKTTAKGPRECSPTSHECYS
jgi:hypothetical protein